MPPELRAYWENAGHTLTAFKQNKQQIAPYEETKDKTECRLKLELGAPWYSVSDMLKMLKMKAFL